MGLGFASGTAAETILGMDDQIEGDLSFQNGRFYASGSIRYTHEPSPSTSRTREEQPALQWNWVRDRGLADSEGVG